ncbi:protein of unknown function [Methylocaldum szegediense]|uniref:Uncharacterized protein n=1 Tax=Methylocaldum szegediense TaxID=73780 RepID=A0ABM9I2X0_9GAMM|nr:protein of unknown function [Methylocaldum szegediense]
MIRQQLAMPFCQVDRKEIRTSVNTETAIGGHGLSEPLESSVVWPNSELMGFASLYPSYADSKQSCEFTARTVRKFYTAVALPFFTGNFRR